MPSVCQLAAEDERSLHFLDGLGDLDATWAGLGAVEGRATTPHTLLVIEDLQTLVGALVAAVEDEPVCADDGLRAEVLPVGPVHRARRRARRAEDAFGGVLEPLALLLGLQVLAGRRVAVGDQERHHGTVGVEERLHVDNEVFEDRQSLDRLDGDLLRRVYVLDQRLAGQAVLAVDSHRVGPAYSVSAGPTESQGTIEVPLDLVQRVEDTVGRLSADLETLPLRLLRHLGVVAEDLYGDVHQYLRSIGL